MAAVRRGAMPKHYFAIAERGSGSTWWISFPDIPGVFSAADDAGKIVSQAQDALASAMDTQRILSPSVEEGAKPPDLTDFDQPAMVVLIPFDGRCRGGLAIRRIT